MDTTYRKNLKAVLTASKDYTDKVRDNLRWELGTYDLSITTDSTTAYTKTIPTNTIKGRLNYIGGMSYKYNQVASITSGSGTDTSSTNVVTLTLNDVSDISVVNHKYLFAINILVSDNSILIKVKVRRPFISSETTLLSSKSRYYFIGTATEITSPTMQIVKSSTATSGETYSYDTANVIDLTAIFGSGNEPNDVATAKTQLKAMGIDIDQYNEYNLGTIRDSEVSSVVISGTDVSPITKAIPQEILNDVRYGLGFSDTQFNKLDLITKHLTGEWNIVDLGTLNWIVNSDQPNCFRATLSDIKLGDGLIPNVIIPKYTPRVQSGTDGAVANDLSISVFNNTHIVFIHDNSFNEDAQAFKTAMSGVYLLYQTATQFDVDFSQYIDDDFKNIDTTNMTTITFENEFEYDVPSEIDYLIEEVKA